MSVKIKIDASDILKGQKIVANAIKNAPKVVAASMNKALEQTNPEAAGMVSSIYNIGTPSLKVNKASAGNLVGSIEGSGGMLPVSQFGPSEEGNKIVSVSIKRGSRKPIMPSSVGRGAFMTGDGRVMERRQDSQYPIFPVSTIGIPQMLGSKAISNPIREKIGQITIAEITKRIWKK